MCDDDAGKKRSTHVVLTYSTKIQSEESKKPVGTAWRGRAVTFAAVTTVGVGLDDDRAVRVQTGAAYVTGRVCPDGKMSTRDERREKKIK